MTRNRVIDCLRKKYGGVWTYDREYYGHRWVGPEFSVVRCSKLPYFPEDEEKALTVYIRTDINEQIYLYDYLL